MSTENLTINEGEILSGAGAVEAVAELATAARGPAVVVQPEDSALPHVFLVPPGHSLVTSDFTDYGPAPRRASDRSRVVRTEADLITLCKELGEFPRVYGDSVTQRVVAVLNDDRSDEQPGWRDDRVVLGLEKTDEWKAWVEHSGKLMSQEDFAAFLDDHRRVVVGMDAAELLEIVQTLEGNVQSRVSSSVRTRDGRRKIVFDERVEAAGGADGELELPTEVELSLTPWKGALDRDPVSVNARLFFRIRSGTLSIGYKLDDLDDVLDNAFDEILRTVAAEGIPVVHGTP